MIIISLAIVFVHVHVYMQVINHSLHAAHFHWKNIVTEQYTVSVEPIEGTVGETVHTCVCTAHTVHFYYVCTPIIPAYMYLTHLMCLVAMLVRSW